MAKNPNLKRAHATSEFTGDRIIELKRCAADPIYFMETYVKVSHPVKGAVPFALYPFQKEMVMAIHENKDTVLLCSRQMGKTTVAAMYILWFATFHGSKRCVIASKAMNHAVEIQSRIKYAYEELPEWLKAGCTFYNRTSIEFDNKSVIICEATSEKTGRGGSPSILFIDELAFISKRIQDEMWASIAPSLATGGKLILTSTPNGDSDLFALLWANAMAGINSFKPLQFLWWQHPHYDQKYYDEMKGKLGPVKCRQELDCVVGSTIVTVRDVNTGVVRDMTMQELYHPSRQGVRGNDMDIKLNHKYEILTPTGFKPFIGVRVAEQHTVKIKTTSYELECSARHLLKLNGLTWAPAEELLVGDMISTVNGLEPIILITAGSAQTLYDPVEVGEQKEYIGNGIVNHNCEFLSSDALLISSLRLNSLRWKPPLWESLGFKFWVPEEELGGRNKIYMVSMDPATGSGNDFTTIEIFEFPSMEQIGEYRTNDVNIPLTYGKLSWVLRKLTEMKPSGRAEVLWTFERNGIGEAISALYYNDEKQVEEAELVSDHPTKFGVFTTGRQKVLAALQLKSLVEKVGDTSLTLNSEVLIHELKNFVSKGGGYAAKLGYTDDCVMATLGIMRLLKRLSEYNDDAFNKVHEYVDPEASMDDSDEPMPFSIF